MLEDLFPKSTHVTLVGLSGETSDEMIWAFARDKGYSIVTSDKDSFEWQNQKALRHKSFNCTKWMIPLN